MLHNSKLTNLIDSSDLNKSDYKTPSAAIVQSHMNYDDKIIGHNPVVKEKSIFK